MIPCACAVLLILTQTLGPGTFNTTVVGNTEKPEDCLHYTLHFLPDRQWVILDAEYQYPYRQSVHIPLPHSTEFGTHKIYYCRGQRNVSINGQLRAVKETYYRSP